MAVYINFFTGRLVGMEWPDALDTALADSLADQPQILTRDQQRLLDACVEHAGDGARFHKAVAEILGDLPAGRRPTLLHAFYEADRLRSGASDIDRIDETKLAEPQLARVFALERPVQLPEPSIFRRRLRDLIGERGL